MRTILTSILFFICVSAVAGDTLRVSDTKYTVCDFSSEIKYVDFGSGIAAGCSIGAEYEFAGLAAVRAGYHFGAESDGLPSFASVGAGLNVFGVSIDAAYIVAAGSSPMKNTFSVGIGYEF